MRLRTLQAWLALIVAAVPATAQETRLYENRLTPITDPKPLLADHPEFVEPVRELRRFEAPTLVDDEGADLEVRAWRFSYNARGIIEMPNRLRAAETAVIVVHPWGIDDGQGWRTPEPAGICDFCTLDKNALAGRHTREVINPFLKSLRGKAGLVLCSLRGSEKPVHRKLYRTLTSNPTAAERRQAAAELKAALGEFSYKAEPIPTVLKVSKDRPVVDYFAQFHGTDAGPRYNGAGFWDLPVPVTKDLGLEPDDVVLFDAVGYQALKKFLVESRIRHVLLTGYATDMCYGKTTAGYENLARDFNVFLVGDATLATFPSNDTPRFATNASISYAALEHLVTQVSWIKWTGRTEQAAGSSR